MPSITTTPFASSSLYAPSDTYVPNHNAPYVWTDSYASMNPSHSVSNVDLVTTNDNSSLDLTCTCCGCGIKFQFCFEYKLQKNCINSVLDYFNDAHCDMVCQLEIQRRYYSTFVPHAKAGILKNLTNRCNCLNLWDVVCC